jgi:hypothetical protein
MSERIRIHTELAGYLASRSDFELLDLLKPIEGTPGDLVRPEKLLPTSNNSVGA